MSNVIQDLASNSIASPTTGIFLGYIESEDTTETLPLKMYDFLLWSIRHADSTREGAYFVKRLFQGPQEIWQTTHDKIFSIKDLWSITKCPDEALQYLKGIVGWTNELNYITDELDYDTLRRLIASSIPLWRKRGREETIIDLLSLLLNVRCVIWNWFDYRWILDETEFAEHHQGYDSWIINHGEEGMGEYESNLRIVNDGTLNKALLRNILKLLRVCGERIEVIYLTFLDRFLVDDDNSQWNNVEGTALSVLDSVAELDVSSEYQLSIVDIENPYEWSKYVTYFRIQGTGDDGFGIVFYYQDSDNYYGIKFKISPYGSYELFEVYSGTYRAIKIGKLTYDISDDLWYGVRIHVDENVNETVNIKIYLDTELITDSSDIQISNIALAGSSTNGKIYRSVNYGIDWEEIHDTGENTISSLVSFNNGVILAGTYYSSAILRTLDYGDTWSTITNLSGTRVSSLTTFSNGIALAGTYNDGKIYRSVDYGENWIEVESTSGSGIYSMATFSNGIALAGISTNGKILRSDDYGETWSEVEDLPETYINDIITYDSGIALAGTTNGKIYRSVNYGDDWTEVEDTTESSVIALAKFDNGIVLAGTALGGKILRSTDYGATWIQVDNTPETYVESIATFDNGVAIAGTGNDGKIYRSIDYGVTWSVTEDTDETIIYSIITLKYTPINTLEKGTIGIFAEIGSTMKLGECELLRLPVDSETLEING